MVSEQIREMFPLKGSGFDVPLGILIAFLLRILMPSAWHDHMLANGIIKTLF